MIFICPHEIQYVVTISIGSSIYTGKAMQEPHAAPLQIDVCD